MNASPATVAVIVRKANERKERAAQVTQDVRVLAFTSQTGVVRPTQNFLHEHVMDVVDADLPGDRTIGWCECGWLMDTGTWDERNA